MVHPGSDFHRPFERMALKKHGMSLAVSGFHEKEK